MNFPNLLSIYRLAAAPVAIWMAIEGHRDAFFILIIVSLATDLVDGPLARLLGQESKFGAKLDTISDACTLLTGIFGLYVFEADLFRNELPWIMGFLVSYAIAAVLSLSKFGRLPAYHLYTSKTAAFLAAIFFVWFYFVGYWRELFLFVTCLGVLANIESSLVSLRLRTPRTDVRSLLDLLRPGRGGKS